MKSIRAERSEIKIGSVVIDCVKYDQMLTFWTDVLHYLPRETDTKDFAILRDPLGRNTNVSLNKVKPSEKPKGRNWLHFDLYANDQGGEVERLLMLGATRHRQTYDPEDDFVVLEDPDGNLFCVVDATRRVVPEKHLERWVDRGWELKAKLQDGRVIIGRRQT